MDARNDRPHHHHPHGSHGCKHGEHGHHRGFGRHGFMGGLGGAMGPHGFGPGGHRMRRGDVRTAILRLLAEEPMHGYQIIQELSARSEGAWSPSAGSVYPTLQQMADEGLIASEETGGKKVFSLTAEGTDAVTALGDQPAPWEAAGGTDSDSQGYREAAGKLMQAMFQLGKSGSTGQLSAGAEVLKDARKRLYEILAQD